MDEQDRPAPEPAAPAAPEPKPSPHAAMVEAWFDRHFRAPAITRSVEAWNVAQAAKQDLIATLDAGA